LQLAILAAVLASALSLPAQPAGDVEQLRQQLRELQANFERIQREQRQQIEALTRKVEELSQQQTTEPKKKEIEAELASELGQTNALPAASTLAKSPWSPAEPLTIARAGSAYLNLSLDTIINLGSSTAAEPSEYLQLGDHDPNQRGFSLGNAEIAFDGAVDPYFKGFANILLKLDENNETEIELEEAYLQTISLPANLQLKAGQFFAAFGRQNPQHPHQWAFADQPIILNRAFGPDGLRNLGAQVSWLVPTPFYTEAFLGVFNGQGETAFSFRNPGEPVDDIDSVHGRATTSRSIGGMDDLLYVPRLATSFELSDQQTLMLGASGAFGPNLTAPDARTQIYGLDLYWKWKPARTQGGFPFVSLQTELLYQRFEAGVDVDRSLPAETLEDWGIYSQVLWGFKRRWVAGLRGEYADGNTGAYDPNDVFRGQRTRVAPNLTFYPSEFSKVRLQYNYDKGQLFGTDHSVWLQLEFLLGAHGAHKF
jgi:hypothetical protein